jgi:hypothetical protein
MRAPAVRQGRHSGSLGAMKEELCHALLEALYELDILPEDEDAALLGLYAVMDDLDQAIRRAQILDLTRSA